MRELLFEYVKTLNYINELRTKLNKEIRKKLMEEVVNNKCSINDFIVNLYELADSPEDKRMKRIIMNMVKRELREIKKKTAYKQSKLDSFIRDFQ